MAGPQIPTTWAKPPPGGKVIGTLSAQTLATCSVGGNLGVHPFMKMPFHRPAPRLDLEDIQLDETLQGVGSDRGEEDLQG